MLFCNYFFNPGFRDCKGRYYFVIFKGLRKKVFGKSGSVVIEGDKTRNILFSNALKLYLAVYLNLVYVI
ncbi:hypothetical protein BC343_26000 [Mucilaginibacter pedocola]|uniref:Uncharacterized protein n=1 Tax=Mucilaginibacter pedocola TaxID=1792845 RepID=A0A1S9PGW9_9SPHI|nr:hypothetical protein BC343_26000 [Mucilaginibacter pedocola]